MTQSKSRRLLYQQARLIRIQWAVILALDLLVTAMIAAFLRVRRTAGLLNVPYLLWTLYATYLCIGVLRLNG